MIHDMVGTMILTNGYIAGFVSLRGYVKGDPVQEYTLQVSGASAMNIMVVIARRYGLEVQTVDYTPKTKWAKPIKAYRITWRQVKLQRLISDCYVHWTEDEQLRFMGNDARTQAKNRSQYQNLLNWIGDKEVTTNDAQVYLQVNRSTAHKRLHRLMQSGLVDREIADGGINMWSRVGD